MGTLRFFPHGWRNSLCVVSIQLGSPASGDYEFEGRWQDCRPVCFHSIGIPSEWGHTQAPVQEHTQFGFHSIGIPSEWGHTCYNPLQLEKGKGFHSIGIPSEWGLGLEDDHYTWFYQSFHSIGIPSEWGHHPTNPMCVPKGVGFHSIGIPSEWGLASTLVLDSHGRQFPFNWDPQRVGTLPH